MRTLVKRGEFVADARLRRALPRIGLATLVMGAALWIVAAALEPWFAPPSGTVVRLGALAVLVGAGLLVYAVAVLAAGRLRPAPAAQPPAAQPVDRPPDRTAPVGRGLASARASRHNPRRSTQGHPMQLPQKPTPRVFSGMQPTGNLHLGNYLGAMVRWVEMQKSHECIYCVVDMHAITMWQDPKELKAAIRSVTAAYMAAGLDPKKSILFNQSQVHEHAELAWVFNCVARLGWLNRMTQFKEKAGKDRENASVGLYAYPVLMAADILAYRATHVPVGEDQKQHLELARDIAQKFNNDFGDSIREAGFEDGTFFPLPEPVIMGPATRVMSLRDGTKKMSKSEPSDMSRINMTDDADTIAKKIGRAKTDPHPLPATEAELEKRPEADNLIGIYAALADKGKARGACRIRRRPVLHLQEGAGRGGRREAGPRQRRDEPSPGGPRRDRPHPGRGRAQGPGLRRAHRDNGQGYRGFPALLSRLSYEFCLRPSQRRREGAATALYCCRQNPVAA